MYNTDYLPQMERFREHLFGIRGLAGENQRELSAETRRYSLPSKIKVVECHEDINGEWVPHPVEPASSELEK